MTATTMAPPAPAREPARVPAPTEPRPEPIRKVSIIVSHGTVEGIYPALIMANGARMEGMEANLFFTFFGMDAITKAKITKIRVATVGNPALGIPSLFGILPGISAFVTKQLSKKMEAIDIPPIPEFIQLVADSGVKLYACKASVDMFGLERDAFVDDLEDIISVGEFYALAAGGEVIFT